MISIFPFVSAKAIGSVIKKKLGIKCVHSDGINELLRGIRCAPSVNLLL